MEKRQSPVSVRHPAWLRDRVAVDGGALALDEARRWAGALGAEVVICRGLSARVEAQLVVVEAGAGHLRWRVRRTRSPLLVARAPPRGGRILVAADLDDRDDSVLELVARLAQKQSSDVTLITTVEPGIREAEWMSGFGGSSYDFVADDVDARRHDANARLADELERHGLRGEVRVGQTRLVAFILEVAAELDPALIALAAPRRHGLTAALRRSPADEVATLASQSVLVVPARAR
jgi:nucleotide-binding universal stress UspA family protein